ncbi:MAG: rhodanese-like domain-containing protein [Spirochaetes bacterium]|nr:rhodanese-like domain-containing protein [Spirochaetota bacterium]
MKYGILGILLIFSLSCGKKAELHRQLTPAQIEIKTLLEGTALVVDVRNPDEFAAGHYRRAINVPVDEILQRLKDFGDKDHPIVVYAAKGVRSWQAKRILNAEGFTQVADAGSLSELP